MFEPVIHMMKALKKKWLIRVWISYAIISLAIAGLAGEIIHRLLDFSYGLIFPLFILAFICFLALDHNWRITIKDIARFLDARYPSLEESATLLLDDSPGGLLKDVQQKKTATALEAVYPAIHLPSKTSRAIKILVLAVLCCVAVEVFFHAYHSGKTIRTQKIAHSENAIQPLAAIKAIRIRISPPAYTRLPSREQTEPGIYAEEGSSIDWEIQTDQPVKSLGFVFNDSAKIFLKPKNVEHREWTFHSKLQAPGFYQVMVDSQISDHYKLEMIRDLFPEIEVESPKPKTLLEYGMNEQIPLRVTIRDDYGIRSAGIYATISSGNGEAVKFTERKISFGESFQAVLSRYQLNKLIDLRSLGMIPGDELYFYIQATDNHGQEKKSGIYIVALADTADLMRTELAVSGLNVKPEYFRSERQIILETQQLLADWHALSKEAFNNKSNDLGIDQRLLRLRYGKFLGEEEESNEKGNQSDLGNPADFGNAATVLDAYTDKHDNAEDASFFEKETKEQLKATLAEMWNAELQLRTIHPEAALPFEYKALRLLKDLQQKSRVYVAKTGYKTTPLDFGKRGTGEQNKIMNPVEVWDVPDNGGANADLQEALGILQSVKSNPVVDIRSMHILQAAGSRLREKAIQEPAKYLEAYGAFQKVFSLLQKGSGVDDGDLLVVENAIQHLVKTMAEIPSRRKQERNGELPDYYFRNLKNFK